MNKHFAILLLLFLAPACHAKEPWFVLNREIGCERLLEVHDYLTYTRGTWTPEAMFAAVKREHKDAKMVPFLDAVAEERRKSGEPETEGEREYFAFFTRTNAYLIDGKSGPHELVLLNRALCEKLGIMPMEPEQWLADARQWRGKWQGGEEIAPQSFFETSEQGRYEKPSESWHHANFVAERHLKEKSFLEVSVEMAQAHAQGYEPEPGKQAYLVRGVMAGDEAHHRLVLKDGILFVIEQGPRDATLRLAPVVVNLPAAPKEVVVLHEAK